MEKLIKHFQEKGWFLLDFPDPEPARQTRRFLQERLSRHFGRSIPLEEYHFHVNDDEEHTELQIAMTKAFREAGLGPAILSAQLMFFKELIGPDLFGQASPYLRMTRPNCPQDNIGYHRDTFYGGSPYELSVFVPFVDLPSECSLSVLSGSHIHSEERYPTTQIESDSVKKGTSKHQLGFLYAPKLMDPAIDGKMEAIPLKVGQALIFSLSTVHGSIVNRGQITRWSSDMRVMNALAPVDLSARPHYYKPLHYSVVSESAQRYFYANGKEKREDVELGERHAAPL